jgi:ribosomal-protein-alanine N-acetyltransferase
MYIIKTERLQLRNFSNNDAEFIKKLLNEPSFIQNIGDRNIRTIEDAKEYIASRLTASYVKNGHGLYMVELKNSNTPIGMCGLVKRDTLPCADVGFAFLPEYWSKGYAVESSIGVLNYAKNNLKMKRVLGIALPSNKPSVKVLEKIGLKYTETKKFPDDEAELAVYSLEF